jgi:MGT family glycosyltransferase
VLLCATESLLPFLLDDLPRQEPDLVVLDSNALWGHMAAKMLNLPTVSLMTTFMPSAAQFMRLSPREWIHMLRPILPSLPRVASVRSRVIRRFDKSAMPPPAFPARGGLNIAFLPRDFQPQNARVDETFRFVGPMIDPEARRAEIPFDTSGPEPIVYISLGTLHRGSIDFFHQCFEAFADMPPRFVLSVGNETDIQGLGPVPSNFIVRPSVPQLELLRHAAVFITHGGMNSVLEGLSCAVPLIVIPQHFEQLMIGLNVAARGAGIVLRGHVAGKRVTAAELRRALNRVLAEPSFREAASVVQKSLDATGGYRQATDEIQAYIAQAGHARQ